MLQNTLMSDVVTAAAEPVLASAKEGVTRVKNGHGQEFPDFVVKPHPSF